MIKAHPITASWYGVAVPTWIGLALAGPGAAVIACVATTVVGWLCLR